MAVPTSRPQPRVKPRILTASAMKMDARDSEARRRRSQSWQKNAYEYVRVVPELNYASRFYSKMLKPVRIFPALRDAREHLTPIKDGLPVELLDRIQDPGGGRSSLLGNYGRQMFIAGEGRLLGIRLNTDDERWLFTSMDEVEILDDEAVRHKFSDSESPVEYSRREAVAYRFWMPSPERSGEAESPIRSVLEIAGELVDLTRAVRATAVSRIINGLIKVPSELSYGAEEPGTDEDAEANSFLADMIDHFTGVIENAGTPEAAMPFMAEGALEFLAGLDWIRLHDPQNDYLEQGLRKEAIERIAHGLDFPAEYLLSLGNVNHWSARAITHEMWRIHGKPVAEQFCDDLCEAYLRPALREADFADWKNVVIGYDDSQVVVPVDRTDDADKAIAAGTLSDAGHRSMKGIDESLAPNEEEKRIFLAVKLRDTALLKGTRFEVEEPQQAAMPPGPKPGVDSQDPEEGPPLPGPAGVSREESRASALHGTAYAALHRCREIAGARIRNGLKSRSRTAPELAMIDGHKNSETAAVLGPQGIEDRGLAPPHELVRGGAEAFLAICMEWGIEETQAKALAQTIELFAARTLFEKGLPPFPSGFFAQIARASEISTELGEEGIVRRNNEALARLERMLPSGVAILAKGA